MKIKLLVGLALSALTSSAQGYFRAGATLIIEDKPATLGVGFGAGARLNHFGVGFNADFYGLNKNRPDYGIAALDFRYYPIRFPVYASILPGYTMYEKTILGIKTRGSFAFSSMAGVDLWLINLTAGYQYVSFRAEKQKINSHNFKVSLSLLLK